MSRLYTILGYIAYAFVGLAFLPYLLWRVWRNRIPFKRKARGLDLDSSEPELEGQL